MAATDLMAFKPEPFKQVSPGVIPFGSPDAHLLRRGCDIVLPYSQNR